MLIERHDAAHTDPPGRRMYTQAEFDAAQGEIARLRATLQLQQASYEREIQIEVAAERERCAALCELMMLRSDKPHTPADCAAVIRGT